MSTNKIVLWIGLVLSFLVFIIGFLLFYNDTKELTSSMFASLLSSLLFFASFIILSWLVRVFTK